MVWLIALVPVAMLLASRNASNALFSIVVALALLGVTLGNPYFLGLDLVFFVIGLAVTLYLRWDKARPQLTPEQREERERQRREAERIRQEKAAALADIRGNAFWFGLFTPFIVTMGEKAGFPNLSDQAGVVVALLAGILAYQMRVVYLVGKHPRLDQSRDIDMTWAFISVVALALALFFAYMARPPAPGSYTRQYSTEAAPTAQANPSRSDFPTHIPYSEAASSPAPTSPATPPARRKHSSPSNGDLRHCLERGSDAEIARCAERP